MTVSAPPRSTSKPLTIRRLPPRRIPSRRLSADRLDALTGAGRDRVIDLLRLTSLIVVIAGHSLMLTVAIADGRIDLGNLLGDRPVLQIATWLLQILPLFFFAGAAAATYGWRAAPRGRRNAGQWLFARAQRLLRPVFWYLLAVGAVMGILAALGNRVVLDVVARLGVQLLWFLGAYLLVLAVVPLLQRIDDAATLTAAVLACYAVTAAMDLLRLHTDSPTWGYVNYLSVWLIPAVLGVGYAKRLIRPRVALVVAVVMLVVDALLVAVGPYELSLVTVPGQRLSNMTPPSLLLAGHTVVLSCLAIAAAGALARVVARPRVWWWVALGNRGAMTLYLWHLPVLALLIAGGTALGFGRSPHDVGYGWTITVETLLLLTLMVPVVAVLSPLENRPLPWWDTPVARSARPSTDVAVWLLVIATGVAVLMVARGGLLDASGWLLAGLGCALAARLAAGPAGADRNAEPQVR